MRGVELLREKEEVSETERKREIERERESDDKKDMYYMMRIYNCG